MCEGQPHIDRILVRERKDASGTLRQTLIVETSNIDIPHNESPDIDPNYQALRAYLTNLVKQDFGDFTDFEIRPSAAKPDSVTEERRQSLSA